MVIKQCIKIHFKKCYHAQSIRFLYFSLHRDELFTWIIKKREIPGIAAIY